MGGLDSGPGPGITILIAVVLVLAQTASSAPLYEEDEGQESNSQTLAESYGCYYNFQHYNEGERILTNEPCLNCTCRNRMLMCYLRVCPFTKGIGQNCTVEKVPGQCCPIVTCPEVPVQLLTSTTTEGVKGSGNVKGTKGTAVGHLDTNGCNIDNVFYSNGAQVPSSPERPCELCYCIRNKTACIMQECALHVDGCRPVYEEGQCFPVRYQCDDSPYEEEPTTTIRPSPTPGLIITTTSTEPLDCSYNDEVYEDGSRIQTEDPCEHCYCLKGKIACAVQECGAPLEKEGQNCTALPPAPGKCCPDSYQCDVTLTSQGLNQGIEGTTEVRIPSETNADESTDGHYLDQSTGTTEKPKLTTHQLNHASEEVTPLKELAEEKPTAKPQGLDKGTQNELTETHSQGLYPVKPSTTSVDDQKITYPTHKDEDTKLPGISTVSEIDHPEEPHTKRPENYGQKTDGLIIQVPGGKRPLPESESHKYGISTEMPEAVKRGQTQGTASEHSDSFGTQSQTSHDSTIFAPTTKDPLLDKLHNIIQDVQAQVSDGKTTEMPEEANYQTTVQSQMGHFTDKLDILSHLPQLGSQTSSPSPVGTENITNATSSEDKNDIINKLQNIIQGIYSHVTDSIMSTKTPEIATTTDQFQSSLPERLRPEYGPETATTTLEKLGMKPHDENEVSEKPVQGTDKTREPEDKDKYSSEHSFEKPKPGDESIQTEYPEKITSDVTDPFYSISSKYPVKTQTESQETVLGTQYPMGTGLTGTPEDLSKYSNKPTGAASDGFTKLPLRPKPADSHDKAHTSKYPEKLDNEGKKSSSTDYSQVSTKPDLTKYPVNKQPAEESTKLPEESSTYKKPLEQEKYSEEYDTPKEHSKGSEYIEPPKKTDKPDYADNIPTEYPLPGTYSENSKPTEHKPAVYKPDQQYPEGYKPGQVQEGLKPDQKYSEGYKPGQRPEGLKPDQEYPEEYKPDQEYPEKYKPDQEYPEKYKPDQEYPEKYKPDQEYPEKYKPDQEYPEKYKPDQEYPEKYKPNKKYPNGDEPSHTIEKLKPDQTFESPEKSKPGDQYTNKSKPIDHLDRVNTTGQKSNASQPVGSLVTPFGTEQPESGITQSVLHIKLTEQYPVKLTPGSHTTSLKPEEYLEQMKPTQHSDISSGSEYSVGITGKPSDESKYSHGSKYPDKTGINENMHVAKHPESIAETNKPINVSEHPQEIQSTGHYLTHETKIPLTEKPHYSNKYPDDPTEPGQYVTDVTGFTVDFNKYSDNYKPRRPTVNTWPEFSTKDPQKNKPEYDLHGTQYSEEIGLTGMFEVSTEHFESGTYKTDDQTKYPDKFWPTSAPSATHYPETPGITYEFEHHTKYSEDFEFTTRQPGISDLNENLEQSKRPIDSNESQLPNKYSTESGERSTEYPSEIVKHSKPKPELAKPSYTHSATNGRPDEFDNAGVTDILGIFDNYSEKTRPEESQYDSEHSKDVTKKPNDAIKYQGEIKPADEHHHSKYPISGTPQDTNPERPYSTESPEGITLTGIPGDESTPGAEFKPASKYPHAQQPKPVSEGEFYGTERPEITGKPEYPSEGNTDRYSEKNEQIKKPGLSEYPDDIEHPKYPSKPHSESKPYGMEYPDLTHRPEEQYTIYSNGSSDNVNLGSDDNDNDDYQGSKYSEKVSKRPISGGKYPQKQKPEEEVSGTENPIYVTGSSELSEGFKPSKDKEIENQRPGTSASTIGLNSGASKLAISHGKYPQTPKPGYSTEYPNLSEGTEKPSETYDFSEEGTATGKPHDFHKYSQSFESESPKLTDQTQKNFTSVTSDRPADLGKRPQKKPESDNELYDTENPEKLDVTDISISEDKAHDTKYPESKLSSKNKEQGKHPETSESEGRPDVENPEETVTAVSHESHKYPEESFVTQHSEKSKPPSADQLLETGTKSTDMEKNSETRKPVTEQNLTDKPKYPEILKPNLEDLDKRPYSSSTPNEYGYSKEPGKSNVTLENGEEIIKRPYYTTHYPQKPSGSEHSEETSKPQSSEELEYPEKFKPNKYTEKPETQDLPYDTENPETGGPDQTVHILYPHETVATDRPQDLSKYPEKSKPGSSNKSQYLTTPYFVKETFDIGVTEKPDDKQKYPVTAKPGTEDSDTSGTGSQFGTKYSEKVTNEPKYSDQQTEKLTSTSSEKLGLTKIPEKENKYPQKLYDEIFGTEYPETGSDRPEDFDKYPGALKPVKQKYPQNSEHPKLSSRPESKYPESGVTLRPQDQTKYPEGFTSTGQNTQSPLSSGKYPEVKKPQDSEIFYGTEYPNNELTARPEYYTKYPEEFKPTGHYPGATRKPQYSPKHPEKETLYNSELSPGTEHNEGVTDEPSENSEYYETLKPTILYPGKLQDSHKYPESGKPLEAEYPEGVSGKPDDHTKYPEKFTSTGFYTEVTGKPKDNTQYSEEVTEWPGDLSKYPERIKPTGKPSSSESENGKIQNFKPPYGTEFPDIDSNERPEDHTDYPESSTEHFSEDTGKPQGFTKYPESGHPFSTEYPVSGLSSGNYEASQNLTEYPKGVKPMGDHTEGSQSPERVPTQSPQHGIGFSNTEEMDSLEASTKYQEYDRVHATEYPDGLGKLHENSSTYKPSEGSEQTEKSYSTDHSYVTDVTDNYPERFKPEHNKPYPGSLLEYPETGEPKKKYSHENERPVPVGKPVVSEQKKPLESSLTKRPDVLSGPLDKVKPVGSENTSHDIEYPEGVTGKPGDIKYSEEDGTEYPENLTDKPTKESKYPEGQTPTNKYPDDSTYPIINQPFGFVKYPQRPKPGSEKESYGTEYPKITGKPEDYSDFTKHSYESTTSKQSQPSELENNEFTEVPDDSSQFLGEFKPDAGKYPKDPLGSTNQFPSKPVTDYKPFKNHYSNKTERPDIASGYPDFKKPESTESSNVIATSEYPERFTQDEQHPQESKYPETERPKIAYAQKPKPTESYFSTIGTEYPETTDSGKYKAPEVPENSSQHSGAQYPHRPKPVGSEKPHDTNFIGATSRPENTNLYGGINKRPTKYPGSEEETFGTEQPEGLEFTSKPDKTGHLSTRPLLARPKPTGSKPESGIQDEHYGPLYSETTSKPDLEDELQGSEYPETSDKHPYVSQSTDVPHETVFPNTYKPVVTNKPIAPTKNFETITREEFTGKPHGSHKYPQTPKPAELEEDSFNTEYPEMTGPPGETLASGKPDANQSYSKPDTKYPDRSDVSGMPNINKYSNKTKPEDDKFPSEKQKPEPSKHPELESENTSRVTENLDEALKPVDEDKYPDKLSSPSLTEYPEKFTDKGEKKPYTWESSQISGEKKQPEGLLPQKPEYEVYGTRFPEMTETPVHSSGAPIDEFSTIHSVHLTPIKPEKGYLPQGEKFTNENIPSGEHLEENSLPEVSTHPMLSETEIGLTDRIPIPGSSAEENLLSSLHHFGSHQDKPLSADLTHELAIQGVTTKHPKHNATAPSGFNEFSHYPTKPTDETKPTENTEREGGASSSVDDYQGRPKPVVPDKNLYNSLGTSFVESSTFSPESPGDVTSNILESKKPSSAEVSETEKPDVKDTQPSHNEIKEQTSQRPSPPGLSVNSNLSSVHHYESDVKYPEEISTGKPEEDFTAPVKLDQQPTGGSQESTVRPADTHLEGIFNTEIPIGYTTQEGITFAAGGLTEISSQDSVFQIKNTTGTSPDVLIPEKNLTDALTDMQKITNSDDNDLINKLHNIISGIQSQVTEGKTTKSPQEGYESTSSFKLPTETLQDQLPATDKFGRPVQKPQEFAKFPQLPLEQVSETSTSPTDGISENEIYSQTTTETEDQTDRPQFGYTSAVESTKLPNLILSKEPEEIRPVETDDSLLTKTPYQKVTSDYPHWSKPIGSSDKTESSGFPGIKRPNDTNHSGAAISTKDVIGEAFVSGKPKPEDYSSSTEPSEDTEYSSKYPEGTTAEFPHEPSGFSLSSFSTYTEEISATTASFISPKPTGKPVSFERDQVTKEQAESGITSNLQHYSTSNPYFEEQITQIYQEVEEDKKLIENTDNLINGDNTTVSTKPIAEDILHTVTPQDIIHKHPPLVFTDKPVHVVYPTYYPEGIVTHKPDSKPDEAADKKVTVTPQTTYHVDMSTLSSESGLFNVSGSKETPTVYEVHTEINSESFTKPSVVIIQEVHTEVHSERATSKPDATQTAISAGGNIPEHGLDKPQDQSPGIHFEGSTNQPELEGQDPQIVFAQPAQPTEDQTTKKSQTLQSLEGHPVKKGSSTPSVHAEYATKQPEFSTTPGFVTVTPVVIPSNTQESEHIMNLYSPKDKYPQKQTSSAVNLESYTTASTIYSEGVEYSTGKEGSAGITKAPAVTVSDIGMGTTHKPEVFGMQFPSRKTTQKPTPGVSTFQEGATLTPNQGIGEDSAAPHLVYPSITQTPSFIISTEGFHVEDETSEDVMFTTAETGTTRRPQGASFVPYKIINGTKIFYPEKESFETPTAIPPPFEGYDHIPYEVVNGTKFFYPNRITTSQPSLTTSTTSAAMGMYVPYKIVNGTKTYYTQDEPQRPEKFDGLDYVPFDMVNGTKVFYPERVTTRPTPSTAMYVPFKIIGGTKVYYPKDAQEEPQNIPDDYDGFDYVPYIVENGNKIFRPDSIPVHNPETTEPLPTMYVPYKLMNGNKIYYPKDAQSRPDNVPEGYEGFDLVPYEIINGTKLFYPDQASTYGLEQTTTKTPTMLVPYKIINGTKKIYFPKHAQDKLTQVPEGYDGFDSLPYEIINGTKVFQTEKGKPRPEYTSTPAFYPSGMFVPYKIINNTKVFFPKDAQHNPRPLKPSYDGIQYLPYDVINGTKIFYPEKITVPIPNEASAMYVPYKLINGTKVYYAEKATENPEEVSEGFEGFDYVPYETVNGHKLFYPDRVVPTMGMYVPYKKINGTKVYYPKDSSEKHHPVPEGYDGVDFIPYEVINGTKVFYPDRSTTPQPALVMYVPYMMINGKKVYYPKQAQHKPHLVPEGYDGFDSLPYEIVNGTKVFYPENPTEQPTPAISQGMYVPYKIINGTKVYYSQEAHKRPHPLSDEYAGLDYILYEVVNGTKVFHPERLTPSTVPAMFVPYKLTNGTKVFNPKYAQNDSQQIPSEFDGFDYVPYEIVNGTQSFYLNSVPSYPGMYVPYKIINGERVFYPKHAQHKPSNIPEGYDGYDYLPYENINGTKVFKPMETGTETSLEQAMYIPYKIVNRTKIFYSKYAQQKPQLIPQGFDGFEYIPYEIINGTKIFHPELAATPGTTKKPAMYVPFKIVDGKKVYYPKYAQNKPHLVPEGYDGFDYIPYEVVNGSKVFVPEKGIEHETTLRPGLYVPYKIINGIKVYEPKYSQQKPQQTPQGFVGFDYLSYDLINGNKVFYPEPSTFSSQSMYVPYKLINGTKVFYPKHAQYVPTPTPEGYDGFEYIPYDIVNGDKVFYPEQVTTESPLSSAMYVPYKIANGTKVYYPKNAHYNPYQISSGYDGFDYIPYEVVNGSKVFHPEKVTTPGTYVKTAMYVPFKIINGTKTYYPKHAQPKPHLIPEGYAGFDYLPYEIVNGTKIFEPQISGKPTYLQGMYVPYKLANSTKVFYPKDALNKPNYIPKGYDGIDFVPYETVNNTKMFYPELISTAQPTKPLSAGVYVPFKIINNKKVFYPKEETPFPPTVRYPYDGVAFVPHKVLGETNLSEIVYVDNDESFKPQQLLSQPGKVPGEGNCYLNNQTFANNTEIPPVSPCQARCICMSSVVQCVRVKCPVPPESKLDCSPIYREGSCCPTYACGDLEYENPTTVGFTEMKGSEFFGGSSSGQDLDGTTAVNEYVTQKRPIYESGGATGGKKPEMQTPFEEYHLHKPPKPKPGDQESLEPYDGVQGQLTPDEDYDAEEEEPYGPGTCRYAGKVYVSAQQIPRDDPCDFCFCFRSDIICLQQSCPPPIPGCRDEPIQGFCCPRYECHVKMATLLNVTSTTTTTTTLPPHFFPHAFKGSTARTGCFVQGKAYRVGQAIPSASGPCMDCICGGNGRMKCEPKVCTPEPMIRKMISPSENVTTPANER